MRHARRHRRNGKEPDLIGETLRKWQCEHTFAIIKPDAVAVGPHRRRSSRMIEKAGFRIRGMKMNRLSRQQAEGFYDVHRSGRSSAAW